VGSLLPLQITEPVSSEECRKIVSYEREWAFRYQFFAAEAPSIFISHIFWLKPLKLFFCNLKSKLPLKLKVKYQWFNIK
jgi:predicted nucleic acid-binding Zn ribbon protein